MRARDLAFGLPLAALIAWACSRAPEDRTAGTCAALAGTGTLPARWSQVSPPRRGGAIYVFENADLQSLRKAFAALGLEHTEILACKSNVVVFVPGVAEDGAAQLERAIVARTKVRAKERAIIPP